jgi:hypothetical protein
MCRISPILHDVNESLAAKTSVRLGLPQQTVPLLVNDNRNLCKTPPNISKTIVEMSIEIYTGPSSARSALRFDCTPHV